MYSGNYPRAEEAFAAVARVLPLPEVVNNQAVALSRRSKDAAAAIPLFRQATAADPTDADYHFNLAVSLHRHGDQAEALTELAQAIKLHPADSEAKSAQEAWKSNSTASDPLERIKRNYNGAAFRQAALMLDQVEDARLAALPGPQRAARLASSAREKLNRGLLLEAERGFQAALAADTSSDEAKAGLAESGSRARRHPRSSSKVIAASFFPKIIIASNVLAGVAFPDQPGALCGTPLESQSPLRLQDLSRIGN